MAMTDMDEVRLDVLSVRAQLISSCSSLSGVFLIARLRHRETNAVLSSGPQTLSSDRRMPTGRWCSRMKIRQKNAIIESLLKQVRIPAPRAPPRSPSPGADRPCPLQIHNPSLATMMSIASCRMADGPEQPERARLA